MPVRNSKKLSGVAPIKSAGSSSPKPSTASRPAEKLTGKQQSVNPTAKDAAQKPRKRSKKAKPVLDKAAKGSVEAILGKRLNPESFTTEYLVSWAGFSSRHNSWEVLPSLKHAAHLLKDFEDERERTGKTPKLNSCCEDQSEEAAEAIMKQRNELLTSSVRTVEQVLVIRPGCKMAGTRDEFTLLFDDGRVLIVEDVELNGMSQRNFRFVEAYYQSRIDDIAYAKEMNFKANLALAYSLMPADFPGPDW